MKYLLDTNICIYIIKQKPIWVLEKFKQFSNSEIGISSITVSELYYGVAKSNNLEQNKLALENFLLPLTIVPYEISDAFYYGQIRAHLEKLGLIIGPLDMLIAAHALSLDTTLVTHNVKEFQRVPDLKIENWCD